MKRLFSVFLLIVLVLPGAAAASKDSRQLQARGLVEFHAGRYANALALFEQAVGADATDVYARYYRGVTRSRLGDVTGAISDLLAVLAAQPDLDQAALDLGVALVQTGAYGDAVPLLVQAQHARDLDAQASLFLGVAQLRLDDLATARQNFARAAARDPALQISATYYEGVADYREGYTSSAEERFASVANRSPDSEMGREAAAFLVKIHQRQRPVFQGSGSVGFQYDTNVVLAPGDDVIKSAARITKQADGRGTIDLNGTYSLWRGEQAELLLGYEFFQSLHFDLRDFDLQDHGPSLQLVGTTGFFSYGVVGRYDYYLLSSENFLQEASALPWVGIPEGNLGRTEVFYRMRRRDFLDKDFRVRDAFNHAPGVRQYWYVQSPDEYVSVGYRFDREDPINARPKELANQFAYDGHEVSFGIGWELPADLSSFLGYAYRRERYAPPSIGRRDEEHQPTVLVSRRMSEYLTLTGAYLGTFNKSNDPHFDYDRQVASIVLEVRF